MKTYTLYLHYKQGDDFGHILNEADHKVPEALRDWAASFDANAKHCRELAARLENVDVNVQADTHHIGFDPNDKKAEKALAKLAEDGLIDEEEWEDEDDETEDVFMDPDLYTFWSGHDEPDKDKINVLIVESSAHAAALLSPFGCEHERDALVVVAMPSDDECMEWCGCGIDEDFGVMAVHFPNKLEKKDFVASYINFLIGVAKDEN